MQTSNNRHKLNQFIETQKRAGRKVGFVPTMGALHDGHLALVDAVGAKCDVVVVSIYVNPTQFAPHEDFDAYPRDTTRDMAMLESRGVAAVYLPQTQEIYPAGTCTRVRVEGLSDLLDGVFRPHFFYGVSDVVARLFAHVTPDIAAFGEKDFQQLQIIRRMVLDMGWPIDILGVPTQREPDGLAMSSRNVYLTEAERAIAPTLNNTLTQAKGRILAGADIAASENAARLTLLAAGFDTVDYVSIVDRNTLETPTRAVSHGDLRALGAAWLGKTRLIDNL